MSPGPELPWDSQTFKGIDCAKNEQKTARYLGYDDVGEYRKYQASHLFLNLWLLWQSTSESRRFRIYGAFKILSSTKPQDRMEQFGGTIPELQQRYPFSTDAEPDDTVYAENRKRFMTSLLFSLVHDDSGFDPEKQMTLEREEFTNRSDNKTLPKIVDGPITPKWGPHPNEPWGEPYNRAWMCISQFFNTWNRWNERQGKPTGLVKAPIPETIIPTFMLNSNTAGNAPRSQATIEVKQATSMLEPKTFSLYWADDIARKDELEAEHKVIPVFSQKGPDPRALPAAEWRDKVRVLYDFEKLKLNFLSLRLHYKEEDQDEALDLLNEDWSVVQAVCARVDQADLQKIKFRTRPQEVGEVLRERTGVPNVLKQYVEYKGHGHVQQIGAALTDDQEKQGGTAPLDDSRGDPGPEEDQPPEDPISKGAKKLAAQKAIEEKEELFMEKTLLQLAEKVGRRRDPTAGPGMPDPNKAFPADKTDDVLREHGGVDIRLPEQRREWTMKMLVKYGAGVQIKTAQPIDPVVMELSGTTSVSHWTSPKTPLNPDSRDG